VLTERVNHIEILEKEIKKCTSNVLIIYGKMNDKEKRDFREKVKLLKEQSFVIISTGKYIGEGFDEERLDTLYLTMPFKWKGTLSQYVGRIHREKEQKKVVEVYDYIDLGVGIFSNMYAKRQKGYKELGYSLSKSNDAYETYLYDDETYYKKLCDDLKQAYNQVTFVVRYAHQNKINEMILLAHTPKTLIIVDAIETMFFGKEYKKAKSIGANIVVIDNRYVWYGGINPFVYHNNEMSIMRIDDKILAKDIISQVSEE